jgi:alpha-tubulin suppressor-like RCC1 family protein
MRSRTLFLTLTASTCFVIAAACSPDVFVAQRCEPTHFDDGIDCVCLNGTSDGGDKFSSCKAPVGAGGASGSGGAGPSGGAGQGGEGGACKAEAGACEMPPNAICVDSKTLRTYESNGSCVGGVCQYTSTEQACEVGCAMGKCSPIIATQLAAGTGHTCARLNTGKVLCWGENAFGALGNGMTANSLVPVAVTGLDAGVTMAAAGRQFSCARMDSGSVKCWGANDKGQIGDGTTTARTEPVDVVNLTSGISQVSVGGQHACAVTEKGTVKCWGNGSFGQLGAANSLSSSVPIDSFVSTKTAFVATGAAHTCALSAEGAVQCWGSNANGSLGNNNSQGDSNGNPADVVGLKTGVVAISAGRAHTCAVLQTGGLKCWGSNGNGELGDSTRTDRAIPVDVNSAMLGSAVIAVSAAGAHTCALTSAGGLKCWGANSTGALGNNTTVPSLGPVDPIGLSTGVISFAAGGGHTCAGLVVGGVKCWGEGAFGQLGNGEADDRYSPVSVTGLLRPQEPRNILPRWKVRVKALGKCRGLALRLPPMTRLVAKTLCVLSLKLSTMLWMSTSTRSQSSIPSTGRGASRVRSAIASHSFSSAGSVARSFTWNATVTRVSV